MVCVEEEKLDIFTPCLAKSLTSSCNESATGENFYDFKSLCGREEAIKIFGGLPGFFCSLIFCNLNSARFDWALTITF